MVRAAVGQRESAPDQFPWQHRHLFAIGEFDNRFDAGAQDAAWIAEIARVSEPQVSASYVTHRICPSAGATDERSLPVGLGQDESFLIA
jgi:hypothetical protein